MVGCQALADIFTCLLFQGIEIRNFTC